VSKVLLIAQSSLGQSGVQKCGPAGPALPHSTGHDFYSIFLVSAFSCLLLHAGSTHIVLSSSGAARLWWRQHHSEPSLQNKQWDSRLQQLQPLTLPLVEMLVRSLLVLVLRLVLGLLLMGQMLLVLMLLVLLALMLVRMQMLVLMAPRLQQVAVVCNNARAACVSSVCSFVTLHKSSL
jgi:hypothetical protein